MQLKVSKDMYIQCMQTSSLILALKDIFSQSIHNPLQNRTVDEKKTTYLFTKRELESELFVNFAAAVYYKFTEQVYNFKKFNKTSVLTN